MADSWERRQKADAVLIRFLSWTRLLGASVSKQRMCLNRNSVNSLNPAEEGCWLSKLLTGHQNDSDAVLYKDREMLLLSA